jgi:hypothetical protein
MSAPLAGLVVSMMAVLAGETVQTVTAQTIAVPDPLEPVVCVWYRGSPQGAVERDDLVAIRAYGFAAIFWPHRDSEQTARVRRLSEELGLAVVTATDAQARPGTWLNIQTGQLAPGQIPARAWLGIAAGQRIISFEADARTGAGIVDAAGERAPWVAAALAISRQVMTNAALVARMRPAAGVDIQTPSPSSVRLRLLEAPTAWVLVAANPDRSPASIEARFPGTIPFGPWVSLIDGTDMAMVDRPDYHEYRATLEAGDARVYVIDR